MRKPSKYTGHQAGLILALIGLIGATTLVPESAGCAFCGVAAHASMAPAQSTGSFTATGSMTTARVGHTATLLPNGKVLITGGYSPTLQGHYDPAKASAELYDPSTGTFTPTGNMTTARMYHTATLLPDGRVLIAGGQGDSSPNSSLRSAELYDPSTGTFTTTGEMMSAGRVNEDRPAVLLANGKVLITGGPNAELYDPATGAFVKTGVYAGTSRERVETATLLPDGRVLLAGRAAFCGDPQLYDPLTGTFSVTGPMTDCDKVYRAALLPNGKVLFVGTIDSSYIAAAEVYDSASGTFAELKMTIPRHLSTATLLPDGMVLIAGAQVPGGHGDSRAELYDPATGTFSPTGNMLTGHHSHTATLLPDGTVLIAGGYDRWLQPAISRAEIYRPAAPQAGTVTSVSAASFSLTGLSSEAITASFGAKLAVATQAATTLPLPTHLAGTTVKIKDSAGTERLAPLFFVSPTQVNYQTPTGTAAGAATVTIASGDGTVSTGVALIKAVAPSLFAANGNGQGVAAALALRVKADGTRSYEPIAQFDAAQNKFVARPLDLGPETDQVYLILFGTGIRFHNSLSSVIATIGGAYAEVSFAGAQGDFAGLDQINVLVPRSLAGRGEVDVLLTVEAQMANPVQIHIR